MIDMKNNYTTVAGNPVRLLCVDAGGAYPVIGITGECVQSWSIEGYSKYRGSEYNLREIKQTLKIPGWIFSYKSTYTGLWSHAYSKYEESIKSWQLTYPSGIATPIDMEIEIG